MNTYLKRIIIDGLFIGCLVLGLVYQNQYALNVALFWAWSLGGLALIGALIPDHFYDGGDKPTKFGPLAFSWFVALLSSLFLAAFGYMATAAFYLISVSLFATKIKGISEGQND